MKDALIELLKEMKTCSKVAEITKENSLKIKDYHRVDIYYKEELMYGMFAERIERILEETNE